MGWLTKQHTILSLSGLTDRPTYLTVYPSWMTDQHRHLSRLTDQPTYWPVSLGWLTNQHTSLSLTTQHIWLYLLGLTDQPTCLNIFLNWLTDTSLSVRVDWPTNIPAYPSWLTYWPIYLTVYPEWLTNQHTWLSGLTDQLTYPPFFLGWLTDKHTWLSTRTEICVLSVCCQLLTSAYIRTDWLLPSYFASWVLPTLSSFLPIYPAYLSGPTDCLSGPTDWPTSCKPMYIYLGWLPSGLIDHHACVPILHTYLAYIYAYLSELTQKHFCLPFFIIPFHCPDMSEILLKGITKLIHS